MRAEGRFGLDPQDCEILIDGESLLADLLKFYDEGDILRVDIQRVARRTEPPLLQPRGERVKVP